MGGAQKALEKPKEELVICREKDEGGQMASLEYMTVF